MTPKFDNWADVVAFARALPAVEMLPFYGTPCPKLNGKALVAPGREAGSFALMCKPDEKEILLETDPDTFWQTPHYEGWHALLVRFGSDDPERVANVLRRAWWDRAKKRQRRAFGERP
ncbi:MAG: hypothetical protein JNL35_03445 [Sphingopyxis sp.]|nr:hypothetical protein [Sphingopyxis sp.]